MNTFIDHYSSPIGVLEIEANQEAVISIYFVDQQRRARPNPITRQTVQQFTQYFKGMRHQFDLPLAPKGTPFQQQVWQALEQIGHGETCSYSDIAQAINRPKAVRAVGAANGKNPLTIVVPCHRVIGRDGSLTGYASGTERKRWLLDFEADAPKKGRA